MKRAGLISIMLVSLLLASSLALAQDAPPLQPDNEAYEVYNVLAYGLGIFEPDLWRVDSARETTNDTQVLWRLRAQEDKLFFFIHYYFQGEVTPARIDDYFDDETFQELLMYYPPYEQTAFCQQGDLRVYEFYSKTDGIHRILRYWVRQVGEHTVLSVNGVVQQTDRALLDDYGARLFPELPNCDAA